ncbi:MAG: 50S ribosomal protein L1 [Actinobacteria bacterium]|nr:50S ribosomal protein L1 [Actinomycetota bacterium]
MARSKAYKKASELYNRDTFYAPEEALRLAKQGSSTKFDETVDVAIALNIDMKKAEQIVRGTVTLPHGTGKTAKVLVFATGENADAARSAGADYVGADDMLEKVSSGWTDFDAVVSTPDLMAKVGRLGKVLGPRGLMPNPKTGTVTTDVGKAVTDIKGGKIELRADKHGNLQCSIGRVSFDEKALVENFSAVYDEVLRLKPSSAKGKYVKGVTVSTTMGPGIKVDSPVR